MSTENLVIAAVLLIVLAEVTYLVAKLPRQTSSKRRMIFVDTSVLIDGRIVSVAKAGFIGDTLAIPRSVVGELQFLADNSDHDKRARARYGLDVVKELQEIDDLDVVIYQDGSKASEGVDERLLALAKKHAGSVICTIDYNLNKVAVVEGIRVLNVNELAKSLRMSYLPGEKIMLELVQKGQDSHQGVGYLADGTMVVVEHAYKQIGQTIEVEFIRSLQTAAGKMMFAKRVDDKKQASHKRGETPVQAVQSAVASKASLPDQPPKVYHSDRTEQQKTTGVQQKRRTAQGRAPRKKQDSVAKPARTVNKPKTSAQREATLIDLVEKQQ